MLAQPTGMIPQTPVYFNEINMLVVGIFMMEAAFLFFGGGGVDFLGICGFCGFLGILEICGFWGFWVLCRGF